MEKKRRFTRFTARELDSLVEKEGSRSDWPRASGMKEAEIEAAVASDPDETGMVMDWDKATPELPQPKAVLNMRIDRDVLEYFRKTGKGYQTLINAVLRSYVKQKEKQAKQD